MNGKGVKENGRCHCNGRVSVSGNTAEQDRGREVLNDPLH